MISNLFNAIAITIMSGVMAVGGIRSDQVQNTLVVQGTYTAIDGNTYVDYGTHTFSFAANDDDFHYWQYNVSTGVSGDWYDNGYNFAWQYGNMFDVYYNVISTTSPDYFYCFTTRASTNQQVKYMRLCVPADSQIDALEIQIATNDATTLKVGYADATYSQMVDFPPVTNNKANKIILHDIRSFYTNASDIVLPSATDMVCKFYEYSFAWNLTKSCMMKVQFLSGSSNDYNNGYQVGYADGYRTGNNEGYNAGYAAGLSLGQNATFNSLFSSIADTPLRFIYGLFNFDLFGVSALVVVLSLLTFGFTFAIVKKVWK